MDGLSRIQREKSEKKFKKNTSCSIDGKKAGQVFTVNPPVITPDCPSALVTLIFQGPVAAYGEMVKVQVSLFGFITVIFVALMVLVFLTS